MNYPVWEPFMLGGGLVIGIIAISPRLRFAFRGGRRSVSGPHRAQGLSREQSRAAGIREIPLEVLRSCGAGLWSGERRRASGGASGLVNPEATATLIHVFVWGWAIEWVFFIVEIAAAFIYYYGWDRLDPKTHLRVGWIYFGAAWASLLVINGILTFMLTPGRWIETQTFASAYFNPGMLPSLGSADGGVHCAGGCLCSDYFLGGQRHGPAKSGCPLCRQMAADGRADNSICGHLVHLHASQHGARDFHGRAPAVTIFAGLSIFFSALGHGFHLLWSPTSARAISTWYLLSCLPSLPSPQLAVTEWVREGGAQALHHLRLHVLEQVALGRRASAFGRKVC